MTDNASALMSKMGISQSVHHFTTSTSAKYRLNRKPVPITVQIHVMDPGVDLKY